MTTPTDALSGQAFHKFLTLVHITRQYARQMTEQGVSPRDFAVLRFILDMGPSSVGDVQTYLYRSASTTSALVARLEEAGYVTRTRSAEDNRVVIVELTEAGREIALHTPFVGLPLLRRKLLTLPVERLQRLNEALTDLVTLMEVPEAE